MRWLWLLATAAAICFAAAGGRVSAQSPPEAPTMIAVDPGVTSLAVTWLAPANDGGAAITSYDLRHIESDDDATEDDNWTVVGAWSAGALAYVLPGLRDSTSYGVQMRAINAGGPGPWSGTTTGATNDHGGSTGTATTLAPGSSVAGRIDQGEDADFFKIDISAAVDLWIYTTGGIDTIGALLAAGGNQIGSNDDGGLPHGSLNFSIRANLTPGIHYVKVTSYGGLDTGDYTLHAQPVSAPGETIATATTVTPGTLATGRIVTRSGLRGRNVFRFELTSAADVWIHSIGDTDTQGELLDADEERIAFNDDSRFLLSPFGFTLREQLEPGTYYISVQGYIARTGPYTLHLQVVDPGSTRATAAPADFHFPAPGRMNAADDEDYFRLTLDSASQLLIHALGLDRTMSLDATFFDQDGNELDIYRVDQDGYPFQFLDTLDAGVYYIRITSPDGDTGPYMLNPDYYIRARVQEAGCLARGSSQSDPLYGCQWHLNNTGQYPADEYPDGAMQDINVEPAWETTLGDGVNVAVVDGGLDYRHRDLRENINVARNTSSDGTSVWDPFSYHGTSVAGLIGARDNTLGVRGVAPRATLYGYRLDFAAEFVGVADAMAHHQADTAVYNNSWGFGDVGTFDSPSAAWEMAVEQGVTTGYGGKGAFYVWAGGNGAPVDDSNLDGRANHYAVTAVCAVNHADVRSSYSEQGANLWVCAPSSDRGGEPQPGIMTTQGANRFRPDFGGTSAAAPIVSGVAALLRAANDQLTWRDLRLILAASARRNDPDNTGWEEGALKYRPNDNSPTDERYLFNHEYGFGMVDAGAAVAMADSWSSPPAFRQISATAEPELAIPDAPEEEGMPSAVVSSTLTIDPYVGFIEYVAIEVTLTHSFARDLQIELESPAGATSTLAVPNSGLILLLLLFFGGHGVGLDNEAFRFGSARHLGEGAAGEWTLRISDHEAVDTGTLHAWKLTAYGHGYVPGFPAITSATAGTDTITVNWTAPGDIGGSAVSGYDVRHIRSNAEDKANANWTVAEGVWSAGPLSHALTGLTAGARYDVQVSAVNESGAGPWSEPVGGGIPSVPGAPVITAVSPRDGKLAVAWDRPDIDGVVDILRYDARRILSSDSEKTDDSRWTPHPALWARGGAGTRAVLGGLTNDVQYDVQLRAVNSLGVGAWSKTMVGTPAIQNLDPQFPTTTSRTRSLTENVPADRNIGEPFTAVDPDSDAVTYSLSGADASSFGIHTATGQLQTIAPFDYETGPRSYSLTVRASDGKDSSDEADAVIDDSVDVTVTITDENERPVVTGLEQIYKDENSGVFVSTYSVFEPDGDDVTWSLVGLDSTSFAEVSRDPISNAGTVSFLADPDYDAPTDSNGNNSYWFSIAATDEEGLQDTNSLVVYIRDVNEPPVVTGPSSIPFAEHTTVTVGTFSAWDPERIRVILSHTGPDRDGFTFTNGVLSFSSPPDFESPADSDGDNQYRLVIEAADFSYTTSHDVTVSVANLDEAGTLTLSSEQPQIGTELMATLTDLDGSLSGQTWTWERSGDGITWTTITGASGRRYTPVAADLSHYLRVTVTYTDGHGPGKDKQETSDRSARYPPGFNNPPQFGSPTTDRTIPENSGAGTSVGAAVRATDANNDVLSYALSGLDDGSFDIDSSSGQIRVGTGTVLNYERRTRYSVIVTASDPSTDSDTTAVTIMVEDVNEPPVADRDTASTDEDSRGLIDVLANDRDPEGQPLTVTIRTSGTRGRATVGARNLVTYDPTPDSNGIDSFTYAVSDGIQSAAATVFVTVNPVNDAPEFPPDAAERGVSPSAQPGDPVGAPVTATDVDGDVPTYRLTGSTLFEIAPDTAQITVAAGAVLDATNQPTHKVTITADDGNGGTATAEVAITVMTDPVGPQIVIGGGGGVGPPPGPTPSDEDFEWTVTRDIEEFDSGHDTPSGLWSDHTTLWLAENGDGADDAIYAYDLASGERVEDREFELDDANLAPRGIWSDRSTVWVSDSGKNKLFAHDLETGERLPERDLALHPDNDDPRGIWSDGSTMWVLDDRDDALFAYDLASGELLAEYALDAANDTPHGLWSDRVTIWVSNHDPKLLFAYRLPVPGDEEETTAGQRPDLERVRNEEFGASRELTRASNNSPRGLWSDGDVMYVADESDDKVYSYNMPDAIDARLASLTLSGVDFGEFLPRQPEYAGVLAEGVTQTTVEAEAVQDDALVEVAPADADEDADGHQVAVAGGAELTVTVTSADGSRERVYRVRLSAPEPAFDCFAGDVAAGFSLLVYGGGSVDDLEACAQGRHITALYALAGGSYVSYIPGAPDPVNQAFRELFPDGLPSLSALTVSSDGPPSADPLPGSLEGVTPSWPECLRGAVVEGFSLVVYAGGSVDDLETCAQSRQVSALYTLQEGKFVSYIVGAPELVNQAFGELYPEGLPAATPLVASSDGPPSVLGDGDGDADN